MLVNGSFSRLFRASGGGIKVGDPLSPFLFPVVVEALGALLRKVKNLG